MHIDSCYFGSHINNTSCLNSGYTIFLISLFLLQKLAGFKVRMCFVKRYRYYHATVLGLLILLATIIYLNRSLNDAPRFKNKYGLIELGERIYFKNSELKFQDNYMPSVLSSSSPGLRAPIEFTKSVVPNENYVTAPPKNLNSTKAYLVSSSRKTLRRKTGKQFKINRKHGRKVEVIKSTRNVWKSKKIADQFTDVDVGYEVDGFSKASAGLRMPIEKTEHVDEAAAATLEGFMRKEAIKLGLSQPDAPRLIRGRWQSVDGGTDIFLFSAFYDDRRARGSSWIRIPGIAEVGIKNTYCLHWYDSQSNPEVTYAEAIPVGPKISPQGLKLYEQYLFSCRVPPSKKIPINVSLVTTSNIHASTLLPVQVPTKPSQQIEFGHCMSILYWKQDPYRLVEWLEIHRLWGVGEVNIYGHDLDNTTTSILDRYVREGYVRYEEVPTVLEDDDDSNEYTILMNMSPVLNDCMYRNLYRYRYVVCSDLDEMIVPRGRHRNYADVIAYVDQHRNVTSSSNADPIRSYLFRNVYFFLDFGAVADEPWYLTTQRYTRRVRPSRYGYSSKSITRTVDCVGLQNHLCWHPLPQITTDPTWNYDVTVDTAMSHHYKKCHFDQYLGKNGVCLRMMTTSYVDRTMDKFRDAMVERMTVKLQELNLVEVSTGDDWKKDILVPWTWWNILSPGFDYNNKELYSPKYRAYVRINDPFV